MNDVQFYDKGAVDRLVKSRVTADDVRSIVKTATEKLDPKTATAEDIVNAIQRIYGSQP